MTQQVLLVAAFAAALSGMGVRLRRDRIPLRGSLIELATDSEETADMWPTDVFKGFVHDSLPLTDEYPAASVAPPGPTTKESAASSFVYTATLTPGWGRSSAGAKILIVGSHQSAPFGSVTWLPWFFGEFEDFLSRGEPATCFVENENFEWTLNVFPKVRELLKQAEIIKNQNQSWESDSAKIDWIKKYNHQNLTAGLEAKEELTSANFFALQDTLNQEYDALEPHAGGIEVTLYSLFKQFRTASKGLLAVKFIEDISDVNKYVEKEVAALTTNAITPQDLHDQISKLRPAYLKGDAYTYFKKLPLLSSKISVVRSIPERNRKWARTIHDAMQIAMGNRAVVVVGADRLGRTEEKTPDSILDAFESLGYDIVPVDMPTRKGRRKDERRQRTGGERPTKRAKTLG